MSQFVFLTTGTGSWVVGECVVINSVLAVRVQSTQVPGTSTWYGFDPRCFIYNILPAAFAPSDYNNTNNYEIHNDRKAHVLHSCFVMFYSRIDRRDSNRFRK